MLDLKREHFEKAEKQIGKIFSYLPLTPNQYTISSLFFAFISLFFLIKESLLLALIFFIIATFLDFVDGAVARFTNKSSLAGAYLDTIIDRYVEAIIFLGLFFVSLPTILLSPAIWIFLCFLGSLLTTYSKATAKEKDLTTTELKGGIMSRAERILLLYLAILLGIFNLAWTVYVLIIIAVLSNFSAVQRIISAIKINSKQKE